MLFRSPDMKIVREEIFGPVAVVIKFKTEEEALEQANNTEYGLSSYVYTQNLERALRVANAFEAGNCFVSLFGFISHSSMLMASLGQYVRSSVLASSIWRLQAIWARKGARRICA